MANKSSSKTKDRRRDSRSRRSERGLDPPTAEEATSSVSSIFLEDTEDLALKQRESTDVTVPEFNIADYDLGEDYYDHSEEFATDFDKRSSQDHEEEGEGRNGAVDTTETTTRTYSYSELVATLGSDSDQLKSMHPRLHRRVRDFRFARRKRREKQGGHKPWGIFGLYAHLSDIRIDLEWAEDAAWRRENGEPYLSWSDYETARNKGMNRPLFSYLTVFICTIMMIVTFSLNDWEVEPLSVNPLIGPSAEVLIQAGARDTSLIVNEGQWFRLVSPIVLHAGVIHFVINIVALWFIGAAVEQSHGFASAAILFFIPAVGGNILSAIFLPQYISVGASGGIFGLIGGCVADVALNWNLLFIRGEDEDEASSCQHWSAFFWLFADIVANALLGMTPFVDNFTHLGGLLYGICCGISTIERLAIGFFGVGTGRCSRIRNNLVRFCGLIFSVFLIMITTVLLVGSDGATSPCPSCRFVSCVPFPFGTENKWWNCDDCDFAVADLVKLHATSVNYDRIDLTCPNGEIALIDITTEGISDRETVRSMLPKYCRDHCAEKFSH